MKATELEKTDNFIQSCLRRSISRTTIEKMRSIFGKETFNLEEGLESGELSIEDTDKKVAVEWNFKSKISDKYVAIWDYKNFLYCDEPIDIHKEIPFSVYFEDTRDEIYLVKLLAENNLELL